MQATPSTPAPTVTRTTTAPAGPHQNDRQIKGLMRLMARETGKMIRFEIVADKESKVYVAGSFNRWNPTSHVLQHDPADGTFRTALRLPAGTHEYRFVVNGIWQMDARCPHWVLNDHGTLNSVIRI